MTDEATPVVSATQTPAEQPATAPADAPTAEKPPEEPKPSPKDERVAKAFAALQKRYVKLENERKAITEREGRIKPWEAIAEQLESDPVQAIRVLAQRSGRTFSEVYNALTKAHLGETAPKSLEDRVEELQSKLTEREKKELEQQEASKAESMSAKVDEVQRTILADFGEVLKTGEYPHCKAIDAQFGNIAETAYKVLEAAFRKGQRLTYGEALGKVEAELEATHKALGAVGQPTKASDSSPTGGQKPREEDETTPPIRPGARTLTNQTGAAASPPNEPDWRTRRDAWRKGGR